MRKSNLRFDAYAKENEFKLYLNDTGLLMALFGFATKSLNTFIETYFPSVVYKLVGGNIGENDVKLTVPHYLTMFI